MKWISVKDQLPPKDHPVLIFNDGMKVAFIRIDSKKNKVFIEFSCCDSDKDIAVTHWMELPPDPL